MGIKLSSILGHPAIKPIQFFSLRRINYIHTLHVGPCQDHPRARTTGAEQLKLRRSSQIRRRSVQYDTHPKGTSTYDLSYKYYLHESSWAIIWPWMEAHLGIIIEIRLTSYSRIQIIDELKLTVGMVIPNTTDM